MMQHRKRNTTTLPTSAVDPPSSPNGHSNGNGNGNVNGHTNGNGNGIHHQVSSPSNGSSSSNKFLRNYAKHSSSKSTLQQKLIKNLPYVIMIMAISFLLLSFLYFYSSLEYSTQSSLRAATAALGSRSINIWGKTEYSWFLPQRPRAVRYHYDLGETANLESLKLTLKLEPKEKTSFRVQGPVLDFTGEDVMRQKRIMKGSRDYKPSRFDIFETKDCKAQYDWQLHSFPTCNLLLEQDMTDLTPNNVTLVVKPPKYDYNTTDGAEGHELETMKEKHETYELENVRYIAHGYWRDVWKSENFFDSTGERTVLKTLRYEHEYSFRNYDRHRRDAVAMERLTGSEYIMDIYGFCGNSGIFEFADGGSIDDSIFYSKADSDWTSKERLVIAYQVAKGVADMHNFAKEGVSAMAHTDVTGLQFVYVSDAGIYKLNDFNRARFIRWNEKRNEPCGYRIGSNPGNFRSPEEYKYLDQTEMVDVYSMGNILYTLLTKSWPLDDLSEKEAKARVMEGQPPKIPSEIKNSTDPFVQTLVKAIEMCWIYDYKKRAPAREVEIFIDTELTRLGIGRT